VISGHTRLCGVIGWPIEHTRSPALHNAAYAALGLDAVFVPLPVPPGRIGEALAGLRAFRFLGANVTVPYKQDAAALCDRLDDLAAQIGAVNTIRVADDGTLTGFNTDAGGYTDGLDEVAAPRGGVAVVLGAGGAARSVVAALARRGHTVLVVARDVSRAAPMMELGASDVQPWSPGTFRAFTAAQILCDATSAALSPDGETEMVASLPLGLLPDDALVTSLIYHRQPHLLAAAAQHGLRTQDGAAMLIHQAARAFTLMTGKPAPLAVMRQAFLDAGAPAASMRGGAASSQHVGDGRQS
jgi:shikimate dehydrogenase